MKNILSRLCRLEEMQPEALVVVCKLQGEETTLTVDECIRQNGDFIRVQAGSSLADVSKLLDYMAGQNCAIY